MSAEIDFTKVIPSLNIIDDYLSKNDWKVKENANMSYSLQGLNNHIFSKVSNDYWLYQIYPAEIRHAHMQGDMHIHDMQLLSSYCCGWDLQDLLIKGFTGVPGKLSSRPAKHFNSALGQLVNFLFTLQGEIAGAVAVSNFDTLLAPFVAFDGLNYDEVKQAIQTFVYNMNVSTRVGFQTPFSNVTMDVTVPSYLKDQSVVVGGELQPRTYGEFQVEMDLINRAFAEVMSEGDGQGRLFSFPIPTYNIGKDFEWEDDRFEPIWEMTAKYGIPYFANFINSDMDPEDARSMCCRLRLDNRELRKRGGGLFGANPLTGSIGNVTINLPRLGYAAQNLDDFYIRLSEVMELAKQSLIIKRELVEKMTDKGLYPYSRFYLDGVKKRFGKYWANHFNTIGLVGLNEALLNLIGENITTANGQKIGQEILEHMRLVIQTYQEETGTLFNLEATPAEGTSYRLALLDQKAYPEIIFANDEEVKSGEAQPYYTNSSHIPVGYTHDIFEALDLQDGLQTKYTGGTVLHGFIGERLQDTTTTKKLVRKIAENYALPYFTLTPTFSICAQHGYLTGEHHLCPNCGEKAEVYSRVVGYIRPVDQWNAGKQAEYKDRREYEVQRVEA
ncbi:MAG: ribonucleoside triphosphate reductase [Patescibacteria group bacterium]